MTTRRGGYPAQGNTKKSIRDAILFLGGATLSPDVAVWRRDGSGGGRGDDGPSYRVPLLSDRFRKSNNPPTSSSLSSSQSLPSLPLSWSSPFHGGSLLSLFPIGSFGHLHKHANTTCYQHFFVACSRSSPIHRKTPQNAAKHRKYRELAISLRGT